jgi:arabinogalactan oligomer/maltooligosaccharide transport system substrate-binding protein
MKKLIALLLAVLMLASVLVACGESSDKKTDATEAGKSDATQAADNGDDGDEDPFNGEDNISLVVWAPSAAVPLTKTMCDEFKAQYPDKTISIDVKPVEEGDAKAQILNDPQAAADVFSFAVDQLTELNRAKALSSPIDYGFDADIEARDSEASVKAATLNGDLLAYPETGENGYYLVYDKEVVTDEDAKTFEGVLAACRKAGRKFNMDAGNGFYACMFLFTGGVKLTGIENESQQFNDYDEEKVLDTLEAFNALFAEYSDVFQSDNVDKTSAGLAISPKTIAAGIDGSWNATKVAGYLGDNYGAVKLPTINIKGTDTQIISMNGYKLIGVNNYTKFPEASHLLACYLTSEACQMKRAEELAWSPSNKNVAASDVVAKNLGTVACLDQANYSEPQVNIANTFWSPTGALGSYIATQGKLTRDQIKTEFDKAIANIKDE